MRMPREWVRGVQWAAGARAEWEPVLRAAQAAWSEIELVSVSERLRQSALIRLEASEVPRAGADCARAGLGLAILEGAPDGSFRAAVHAPGLSAEWYRAWAESDHDTIGRLLGFPDCCRAFFARAWAVTSDPDVTPAMATVDGPWEANTMLRWLGVRLVPHLPCSGQCEPTVANARAYVEMAARLGIDVGPMEMLLRLPVSHDALNGLLIVSTPHFRFMAGGSRERFTASRPAAPSLPDVWTDNGFGSMAAMERAHSVVLDVVGDARSALDLGAGDGRLLWRMALRGGGAGPWHGVESDEGRVLRGNERHGQRVLVVPDRIEHADAVTGSYDVVLLMPGRLLEMAPHDRHAVLRALPRVGRRLVLYAYDDWLTKHGGLEGLAELAGLRIVGLVKSAPGVAAADGVVDVNPLRRI